MQCNEIFSLHNDRINGSMIKKRHPHWYRSYVSYKALKHQDSEVEVACSDGHYHFLRIPLQETRKYLIIRPMQHSLSANVHPINVFPTKPADLQQEINQGSHGILQRLNGNKFTREDCVSVHLKDWPECGFLVVEKEKKNRVSVVPFILLKPFWATSSPLELSRMVLTYFPLFICSKWSI